MEPIACRNRRQCFKFALRNASVVRLLYASAQMSLRDWARALQGRRSDGFLERRHSLLLTRIVSEPFNKFQNLFIILFCKCPPIHMGFIHVYTGVTYYFILSIQHHLQILGNMDLLSTTHCYRSNHCCCKYTVLH